MTLPPPRSGGTSDRKRSSRYVAVLGAIAVVSVAAWILSGPTTGIAVFVALGNLLLPKQAPFWRKDRR